MAEIIIYKVRGRFWHTCGDMITYSSLKEPEGEETIKEISKEEFDRMIKDGELNFIK